MILVAHLVSLLLTAQVDRYRTVSTYLGGNNVAAWYAQHAGIYCTNHADNTGAFTSQIGGEGFRLSLLLNAAACQIAQSGIEIHSIAKGVSLFSLILKQTGQALQAPDSNHSREAVNKTWEIATQGERIFSEIEQMLDKLKGTDAHESLKALSLQERVKWCFKRHHVTYLLAQLEALKLSLVVLLQTLRLGMSMDVRGYVNDFYVSKCCILTLSEIPSTTR